MVELVVLADRPPGRRFLPDAALVRLGRQPGLEVSLPEPGVWDRHAEIDLRPEGWFRLRGLGQAHVTVNEEPVREHRLRNGDVLGIGSIRLQFGLRAAPQKALALWELGVWSLVAAVAAAALVTMLALGN